MQKAVAALAILITSERHVVFGLFFENLLYAHESYCTYNIIYIFFFKLIILTVMIILFGSLDS